ncbi:hypothetical protein HN51_035973, partial [Arachis hypogaea]
HRWQPTHPTLATSSDHLIATALSHPAPPSSPTSPLVLTLQHTPLLSPKAASQPVRWPPAPFRCGSRMGFTGGPHRRRSCRPQEHGPRLASAPFPRPLCALPASCIVRPALAP